VEPAGEQAQVLRRLWSENSRALNGRFQNLNEVSIVPAGATPDPDCLGVSSGRRCKRAAGLAMAWNANHGADAQAEQKAGGR